MVLDTLSEHIPIKDPSNSTSHPADPPTTTLYNVWVEKSFLVRLSAAYFDPENSKIPKFAQLSRFNDPHFRIFHKFSAVLLARQVHLEAYLQLIFLKKKRILLATYDKIAYLYDSCPWWS